MAFTRSVASLELSSLENRVPITLSSALPGSSEITIDGRNFLYAEHEGSILDQEDVGPTIDCDQLKVIASFACPRALTIAQSIFDPSFSSSSDSDTSSGSRTSTPVLSRSSTPTVSLEVRSPTPKGLESLRSMLRSNSPFQTLDLASNQLPDHNIMPLIETLGTNTRVSSLILDYNAMADESASKLGEVLRTNTMLTSLSLQGNQIGSKGLADLIDGLSQNDSITSLNLKFNVFGNEGIMALQNLLNRNFALQEIHLDSDEEVQRVFNFQMIQTQTQDRPEVEAGLQRNRKNARVRYISLFEILYRHVDQEMCASFPYRTLNSFSVQKLAKFIKRHPYLSSLNLTEIERLSISGREGAIALIEANPHIVSLSPYLDDRTGIRQALAANREK